MEVLPRIEKETRNGATVWVKRAAKDYRNGLQRLLLRGTDAEAELAREAASIRALARRGVCVPVIVEEQPGMLVLSDLGLSVQDSLRLPGAADPLPVLIQAALALAALHEAQGWHGNAVLRNMTRMADGRIGMFDFDHGVPHGLPLRVKQGYDLWLFCSSVLAVTEHSELVSAVLDAYGDRDSRRLVQRVSLRLLPLVCLLSPFLPVLGKDVRRAVALVKALRAA